MDPFHSTLAHQNARTAEEDKSGAKGKEEGEGGNAINGGRKEKEVPKLPKGRASLEGEEMRISAAD